jgi:hypothetical protein
MSLCAVNSYNSFSRSFLLSWSVSRVVGLGTMLQAGRLWVWFPMSSLDFSIDLILPAALWPWGCQLLTEVSTGNISGDIEWPVQEADLSTACDPVA